MSDTQITPEVGEELSIAEIERQTKVLQLQLAKQALEAQALELEERKYHIRDLKARLADRDITEKQLKEDREHQGRTFAQQAASDEYKWSVCTHKKGGTVSQRDNHVLSTGGNAAQFAVIKHQMINGDIWVRCLRCGRTWAPPVEKNFFFDAKGKKVAPADGKFDRVRFEKAQDNYKMATMYETNNSMSTSVQCRFQQFDPESGKLFDATDQYRDNISSTNLR